MEVGGRFFEKSECTYMAGPPGGPGTPPPGGGPGGPPRGGARRRAPREGAREEEPGRLGIRRTSLVKIVKSCNLQNP